MPENNSTNQQHPDDAQSSSPNPDQIDSSGVPLEDNLDLEEQIEAAKQESLEYMKSQQTESDKSASESKKNSSRSSSSQEKIQDSHSSGSHPEKKTHRSSLVSPIRTYEHDTQQALSEKNASTVDIALEQQRANREAEVQDSKDRNGFKTALTTFLSVILIAGAVAVAGYAVYVYVLNQPNSGITTTANYPQLFYTENTRAVESASSTVLASRIDAARTNPGSQTGEATLIYLTAPTQDIQRILGFNEFIARTRARVPASLARATTEYMYGVLDSGELHPFLVLRVNSYEQAFAAMLRWEPTITEDISPLFGDLFENLEGDSFEDRVIENKDTRLVPDQSGTPALIYTFFDQQTLVITTGSQPLIDILERLHRQQFQNNN